MSLDNCLDPFFLNVKSAGLGHYGRYFSVHRLSERLEACKQCEALYEIDWSISADTVVRPDVLVIRYEPEEQVTKAPELIFAVISPSTARRANN